MPPPARGGRIVPLDGLRGVALLIIMGYHFGVGWLQGGFFSLDIFYVLSGYLITGLLLGEARRRGRIGLSAFWLRRARRLLPALLLVLVAVSVFVRLVAEAGTYPDFRMSALSALFYFSNWWQIGASGNYFVATGAVSPLTHTWSLAVEEQFYLVWPLVVLVVLKLSGSFRRAVRVLLALSLAGALASTVEMALLYHPGTNTTRLYFGTDTHAESILIGAALAAVATLVEVRRHADGFAPEARSTAWRWAVGGLGLAGLAAMLALADLGRGTSAQAYRGGFALSALTAAAVVGGAVCLPRGPLARLLSVRPLVWLGTISYGAYLWHFPVYVVVDEARTGLSGLALLGARFGATVVLATASFLLVEHPVMTGRFWRTLKAAAPSAALMAGTVAVVIASTEVAATAAPTVTRFVRPGVPGVAAAPPEVVVLGDSTALTLGYALAATAPAGTTVVDGGLFGCGLAMATYSSSAPPQRQLAMFSACNPQTTPTDQQWPARDRGFVAGTKPGDVVLFVAGDWETHDLLHDGRWVDITQPAFRRYEVDQLHRLIAIATAHGAHLDLCTMPAEDGAMQTGVSSIDSDSPERRAIYNQMLEAAAARYPGKVSILGYAHILTPDGAFAEHLDGVQVRTIDGVHTPSYAPGNIYAGNSTQAEADSFYNWIKPRIWPLIDASAVATSRPSSA